MAIPMRPTFLLLCFLLSLFLPSLAQNCSSDTFSQNRLYATCSSLPELSAAIHWSYHPSNQTVDLAYRVPQVSTGWAGWAINPTGSGMIGANALLAFHDSTTGAVTVITTVLTSTSPTVKNESLSYPVYSQSAEYANGMYTIYATVGLPTNQTTSWNTAWQAGTTFSNGLPYGHPTSGANIQSFEKLDFATGISAPSSGGGASSLQHRKNIHGVLNAVSWGTLLPLGAIIARYLKVFKSADPAWFYLHITCQLSAYVIGVAGWGLGLKLGHEAPAVQYHSHRDIGIALFCLATLQVFALLLRPKKDHAYRIYWNFYHHGIGYIVIILSVVNVFKGLHLLDPEKKYKHAYTGVIVTLAAIAVVLEVITWGIVLKRRKLETSEKPPRGANGSNGYGGMQQPAA